MDIFDVLAYITAAALAINLYLSVKVRNVRIQRRRNRIRSQKRRAAFVPVEVYDLSSEEWSEVTE